MHCENDERQAIFHNVLRILGMIALGTAMMVTNLLIFVQRSRICPSLSSSLKLPNFCLQSSSNCVQRSSKEMKTSGSAAFGFSSIELSDIIIVIC